MSDNVIYTEPLDNDALTTRAGANGGEDWSGWERWLQAHLDNERQAILGIAMDAVGDVIGERLCRH
jgi:hypothetical protein